jgi:hypothetical protein
MRPTLLALLLFLPACYNPDDQAKGFSPALPGNRARYIEETHDPAPLEEAPISQPTGPVAPTPLPPPQPAPKGPE